MDLPPAAVLAAVEAAVLAEYWTGTVFSDQFQSAVTFTTYREAERYQKVHNLENTSMIEQQCFRREQMVIAA